MLNLTPLALFGGFSSVCCRKIYPGSLEIGTKTIKEPLKKAKMALEAKSLPKIVQKAGRRTKNTSNQAGKSKKCLKMDQGAVEKLKDTQNWQFLALERSNVTSDIPRSHKNRKNCFKMALGAFIKSKFTFRKAREPCEVPQLH